MEAAEMRGPVAAEELEGEPSPPADLPLTPEQQALVQENLRLVGYFLKQRRGAHLYHADLYQEAVLGLMRAAQRFDPGRGVRFSTYAGHWIRQAIERALSDKDRDVRVPIFSKAKQDLDLGAPRLMVRVSIDQPYFEDGTPLGELPGPQISVWEDLDETGRARRLWDALDVLDARERAVLVRRFGLLDGEPGFLGEIGADFEVSRERIRQIEARALGKLYEVLDDVLGEQEPAEAGPAPGAKEGAEEARSLAPCLLARHPPSEAPPEPPRSVRSRPAPAAFQLVRGPSTAEFPQLLPAGTKSPPRPLIGSAPLRAETQAAPAPAER